MASRNSGQAQGRGVEDATVLQEFPGGGEDGFRSGEVRFAHFHMDDVPPLGFQLPGPAQQFHDVEGSDVGEAGGGDGHGGFPWGGGCRGEGLRAKRKAALRRPSQS